MVLVSVKNGKHWCLPKGIINRDETPETTALREVREESGLTGKIIDKIGEITYWFFVRKDNIKCRKKVYFYLMEYAEGSTDSHDREVDSAAWFQIDAAIAKASFRGDKEILTKAKAKIASLPEGRV